MENDEDDERFQYDMVIDKEDVDEIPDQKMNHAGRRQYF
jgi:hypothetical protein